MKVFVYMICFFGLVGCATSHPEIPKDLRIIAKYKVFDEVSSPRMSNCASEVMAFTEMDKYDCAFRIGNLEFDIIEKYVLDEKGDLEEYWSYKSEGPLVYSRKTMEADVKFYELIMEDEAQDIEIVSKNQIRVALDTLIMESVYEVEKLILMAQKPEQKKMGRRIIFEYK